MSSQNAQTAGSERNLSEPRYLIIGRVTRPHGVSGEVRAQIHTDQPERFTWLEQLFVGEDDPTPLTVEKVRFHHGIVILKLGGVNSRNQAEALRNQWLQVPIEEAIPLEIGEFFLYQLLGLEVQTVGGEKLGKVVDILQTGANDVFVVRGYNDAAGELLLPDIPEVVLEIDPAAGRILVQLLPGLRDK